MVRDRLIRLDDKNSKRKRRAKLASEDTIAIDVDIEDGDAQYDLIYDENDMMHDLCAAMGDMVQVLTDSDFKPSHAPDIEHPASDPRVLAAEFYRYLDDPDNSYQGICGVCGTCHFGRDLYGTDVAKSDINLKIVNHEVLDKFRHVSHMPLCNDCHMSISAGKVPEMSLYFLGNIPSSIPSVLSQLTEAEALCLTPSRTFMRLHMLKYGMFATSGNSITCRQDLSEMLQHLPPSINDLASRVRVNIVSASTAFTQLELKAKFPHLVIRRDVFRDAFIYLKAHHPTISTIAWKHEFWIQYPTDAVPDEFISVTPTSDIVDDDLGPPTGFDFRSLNLPAPLVEKATEHHSNAPITSESKLRQTLDMEYNFGEAINEFEEPFFFTNAFPTLFPNGVGDFNTAPPVARKKNLRTWITRHLRFSDTRFQRNPTFVAYVTNMMARHDHISKCKLVTRQEKISPHIQQSIIRATSSTISDHKEYEKVIKAISVVTQHMPGSRANKDLGLRMMKTMIREHDGVNVFTTLSSGAYHWPETQRLIRQRLLLQDNVSVDKEDLMRLYPIPGYAERVLYCNTYLVEMCFSFKIRQVGFTKYMLSPDSNVHPGGGIYGIVECEYIEPENHSRGDYHTHSIKKLRHVPDVADTVEFKKFWDSRCTAFIPDLDVSDKRLTTSYVPTIEDLNNHPSTRRADLTKTNQQMDEDFADMVLSVQLHKSHDTSYCLRLDKTTKKLKCRFDAPWPVMDESDISMTDSKKFMPRRNHEAISNCNYWTTLVYRANNNVQVIFSYEAAIRYIAKYMAKGDFKDQRVLEVMKKILDDTELGQEEVWKRLCQFVNSMSYEREIPLQESVGNVLSLRLRHCSDTIREVYITSEKPTKELARVANLDDNSSACLIQVSTLYIDYPMRPHSLIHVSSWTFLRCFEKRLRSGFACFDFKAEHPQVTSHVLVKLDVRFWRVINILPVLDIDENDPEFCRQMLIAFCPWVYNSTNHMAIRFVPKEGSNSFVIPIGKLTGKGTRKHVWNKVIDYFNGEFLSSDTSLQYKQYRDSRVSMKLASMVLSNKNFSALEIDDSSAPIVDLQQHLLDRDNIASLRDTGIVAHVRQQSITDVTTNDALICLRIARSFGLFQVKPSSSLKNLKAHTVTIIDDTQMAIINQWFEDLLALTGDLKEVGHEMLSGSVNILNTEQRLGFAIFRAHLDTMLSYNHTQDLKMPPPLHMRIAGYAGTGKSTVLTAMKNLLLYHGLHDRFHVAAYSGKASVNVGGQTICSLFNVSISKSKAREKRQTGSYSLNVKTKDNLNEKFANVWYLFLDEYSMVSVQDLFEISQNLNIALDRHDTMFGGLSTIWFGDSLQLPSVCQTSLHHNRKKKVHASIQLGDIIWDKSIHSGDSISISIPFSDRDSNYWATVAVAIPIFRLKIDSNSVKVSISSKISDRIQPDSIPLKHGKGTCIYGGRI
jgi:hypothetical protein